MMNSHPATRWLQAALLLLAGQAMGRAQGLSFTNDQVPIAVGMEPTCVIAAQLRTNGLIDLVTANNAGNTLTILTNTGNGAFVVAADIPVGNNVSQPSGPACVAAADLNGDGAVDLVCVNEFDNDFGNPGTLSILTNAGGLQFIQAAVIPVGELPYWVAVADFNGDGKPDLVCANSGGDTLTILTNAGNAVFIPCSTNTVGNWPFFVLARDVNGDHSIDLVSANYEDDTVTVLTNNGRGVFSPASTHSTGHSPSSIAALDVNGQSCAELIVANSGSDTLTVLTNAGAGQFASFATLQVGNGPQSVVAADVNYDGLVDIFCANYVDNTISVLTNNGAGQFLAGALIRDTNGPYCVAAADVRGDGNTGLIAADLNQSTVTVLRDTARFSFDQPSFSPATGFRALLSATGGGRTSVLQVSTDLLSWFPLATNLNTNGPWVFTDTATNFPQRYYRAVMP